MRRTYQKRKSTHHSKRTNGSLCTGRNKQIRTRQKGLDIEEQKLIKDIVLGMLEIASKGAGAALGAKVGKTGFQ